MSEYYSKSNNIKGEGFIDINQLESTDYIKELVYIDNALSKLHESMYKYLEDVKMIWDTELVKFMNSQDCLILQNLSHYDYNKFVDFMTSQKTFKSMLSAQNGLLKRKEFIEKTVI